MLTGWSASSPVLSKRRSFQVPGGGGCVPLHAPSSLPVLTALSEFIEAIALLVTTVFLLVAERSRRCRMGLLVGARHGKDMAVMEALPRFAPYTCAAVQSQRLLRNTSQTRHPGNVCLLHGDCESSTELLR